MKSFLIWFRPHHHNRILTSATANLELEGCKRNCIYFTDSNDIGFALRELIRSDGSVFSLEDRSINWLSSSPVYSQMFWPLPA
ncbi:hypothetical protein CerSpe_116750 [Prunus speciosa]